MVPSELNGLAVYFDPSPLNVSVSKPINLDMPDFDIYSAEMNQIAHSDKQMTSNLKRISEIISTTKIYIFFDRWQIGSCYWLDW